MSKDHTPKYMQTPEYQRIIEALNETTPNLDEAQARYMQQMQRYSALLKEYGTDYAKYISDNALVTMETAFIEGQDGQGLQATTMTVDAPDDIKEEAAAIMNTKKDAVRSEITVISTVESGDILDVIGKMRDVLSNNSINMPFSDDQKKAIIKRLDDITEKSQGITFTKALTDVSCLKLSKEEIDLFKKMNGIISEIEKADSAWTQAQNTIKEKESLVADLNSLIQSNSIANQFAKGIENITNSVCDKMNAVIQKLSDTKESINNYFQGKKDDFWMNVKKVSFKSLVNKATNAIKDTFSKNIFKSIAENIHPEAVGVAIGNLARSSPEACQLVQVALIPVNLVAYSFYALTGIKPTALENLNKDLREAGKAHFHQHLDKVVAYSYENSADEHQKIKEKFEQKATTLYDKKTEIEENIEAIISTRSEIVTNIANVEDKKDGYVQNIKNALREATSGAIEIAADVEFDVKAVKGLIKIAEKAGYDMSSAKADFGALVKMETQLTQLNKALAQAGKALNKEESRQASTEAKFKHTEKKVLKEAAKVDKYEKKADKWEAKANKHDEVLKKRSSDDFTR